MASFTCLLQHSPSQGQHSLSAYKFCCAAVEAGHQITQVFFYADAVGHGNPNLNFSQDEQNMQKLWQQFSRNFSVPLVVCATVATRHGVIDSTQKLAKHFSAGGLAEFMATTATSDHLVQF